MTLDDVVKEHVLKVVASTKNKEEAAKVLGISRRTVLNYLYRWGIMVKRGEGCTRNLTTKQRDNYANKTRINKEYKRRDVDNDMF